jgi:hypothetical protein
VTRAKRKAMRAADHLFEKMLNGFGRYFPAGFDRVQLAAIINEALSARGSQNWADTVSKSTLHEIARPLADVIKLLDTPRNWDIAINALADDHTWGAFEQAELQYIDLLRDLRKISCAVPPRPKRGTGRPPKTKDLYALVDRLATYWEKETGQQFKQSWHKERTGESKGQRRPTTNAAAFIYDVVQLVDPLHGGALPKVTERIVAERRATTSRK